MSDMIHEPYKLGVQYCVWYLSQMADTIKNYQDLSDYII